MEKKKAKIDFCLNCFANTPHKMIEEKFTYIMIECQKCGYETVYYKQNPNGKK